jgi:hypothetical protein
MSRTGKLDDLTTVGVPPGQVNARFAPVFLAVARLADGAKA